MRDAIWFFKSVINSSKNAFLLLSSQDGRRLFIASNIFFLKLFKVIWSYFVSVQCYIPVQIGKQLFELYDLLVYFCIFMLSLGKFAELWLGFSECYGLINALHDFAQIKEKFSLECFINYNPAEIDVFKTSSRCLKNVMTSCDQTRRRQDVLQKTSDLRRLEDVRFTSS